MNIPILKIRTREGTENNEKAKAFLEAFFPKMAEAEEEEIITPVAVSVISAGPSQAELIPGTVPRMSLVV